MKILFLIPHLFIPPTLGNKYLVYNLLKYVTEHAECDLVLLIDKDIDKEATVRIIREHFSSVGEIHFFDKPGGLKREWQRFKSLIFGYHQAVGNFWSQHLAEWLHRRTTRGDYDVVHFDMLYMAPYVSFCKNTRTLLVPSDAYSMTAMNVYKRTGNLRCKVRLLLEYLIMSNCERKYRGFDLICPVAETDSIYLNAKMENTRFKTIGIGVGEDYVLMKPRSFENSGDHECGMLYSGPLFLPWVAENLVKFIKCTYPMIREQVPEARLTLLGKRPAPALRRLIDSDKDIQHIDFVEDYVGFLNRDWVYIHPQHGSAGYKTKIQQILALGLPVVGSELAFTGMDLVPGEHCYLCKTEKEFSANVIKLLLDEELRERTGLAAAARIREKHSIEKVGEEMMDIYRLLVK